MNNKPRVIKDYEKLDENLQQQIKLTYPNGFRKNLIKFNDQKGNRVSALPFETEDKYYLIRMTIAEAKRIVENDDDYDIDGILTDEARESYEDNLDDVDVVDEYDESYEDMDD